MSSKQSTSKTDPRIAKKEVIVTRNKSAQMKRQLRAKDRSMKHITDLLKSPTKEMQTTTKTKPKTPPKLKQSLLKSIEKVQKLPEKVFRLSKMLRKKISDVHDEEYYPNKKKRKVDVHRVVLKPTNDLKLVGSITGSVKRKSSVPHRASKPNRSSEAPSPEYAELSMAEVIRMMEDDLTDEDMMEILTCPSPVWWEDPPDEEYIEDAIFTRSPEPKPEKKPAADKTEADVTDLVETIGIVDKPIEITNLDDKSDNFLRKRSKLEGLLGRMKNKTDIKVGQAKKDVFNEDLVFMCSGYRRRDSEFMNHVLDEKEERQGLSESSDEISLHDTSMNVDDFLNDLENMNIPVEEKSDVIVIEDDDGSDKCNRLSEIKKRPKKETVKMKANSDETMHMLKNVPVLKKYRLERQLASPKSFDSCSSKTSETGLDIDSISDTNVKYILDDDEDEENQAIKLKKLNKDTNNQFEVDKRDVNEGSVHKVNEEVNDKTKKPNHVDAIKIEEKEVKMNDYYKTCKKINPKKVRKVESDTDLNRNALSECYSLMICEACKPQTKKVSDDKNVKYCLKCSCIFDSKECTYCIEKSKSNAFKCAACRMKFCCKAYFQVHTLSHLEKLT